MIGSPVVGPPIPDAAPAHGPAKHNRRLRLLVAWLPGVLLLLALVGVYLRFGEIEHMIQLVRNVKFGWLALGLLLQFGTYASAAMIWHVSLHRAGHGRRLGGLILLGVAKLFTDQALPSGGISGSVLVVVALKRRGVSNHIAMAVLLVGVLSLYIALLLSAGISLAILALHHALSAPIIGVSAAFAAIAVGLLSSGLWLRRSRGPRMERVMRYLPAIRHLWNMFQQAPAWLLRDPALILSTSFFQFAIIALDAATLKVMLIALGQDVGIPLAFAGFVLATLVADVMPIPLGLGSFEAALVSLLSLGGVNLSPAVAATLLLRGLTFWLPMLPGLLLARREIRLAGVLRRHA
jgi:uncharacterized protein (TIRG00374 family)